MSDTAVGVTESNGHSVNGTIMNGVTVPKNESLNLDKTNQDIVRLIGQHLKIVGLEWVPHWKCNTV